MNSNPNRTPASTLRLPDRDTPARSKTPPPKFDPTPVSMKAQFVPRHLTTGSKSTAVSGSRAPKMVTKSAECLSTGEPFKIPKEVPSIQDEIDLRYNVYLQTCLMTAHARQVRMQKERRVVELIENIQVNIINVEEKLNILNTALEKINFFKQVKEILMKKIDEYNQIIDSINVDELDNEIQALEEHLHVVQLKNFKLPETEEEGGEYSKCNFIGCLLLIHPNSIIKFTELVLKYLKQISNELSAIPTVRKIVQPVNDVRSTLLKTKEYIEKEQQLTEQCESQLKKAEETLYHELYLRMQIETDDDLKK